MNAGMDRFALESNAAVLGVQEIAVRLTAEEVRMYLDPELEILY